MYTSIRAELQKARRRHDLIVCLLVPVMALLWCQSAAPTGADELASAYSALFYSLPIINTILMPLAMAILASRLWDVEVKGCTPKLLYTLQSRRSLFAAKLLHGTLAAVLTAFLFSLSPAVLTVSSPELTPAPVQFRYTLAVLFVSALYPIWGWKKRRK